MVKQQISNLRSGVRFSYPAPYKSIFQYGIFWRLGYKVWQGTVNPPRKLTNGSIPLVSTKEPGLVDQLVRLLACHARGRGFESRPVRQKLGRVSSLF